MVLPLHHHRPEALDAAQALQVDELGGAHGEAQVAYNVIE